MLFLQAACDDSARGKKPFPSRGSYPVVWSCEEHVLAPENGGFYPAPLHGENLPQSHLGAGPRAPPRPGVRIYLQRVNFVPPGTGSVLHGSLTFSLDQTLWSV